MPVYVSEYTSLGTDDNGVRLPISPGVAAAEQRIAVGATSAQSAAFGPHVRFVRVHASEAVGLAFGAAPTALDNRHVLGAGATEWYSVAPGHRLAVIAAE